MTTKLALGYVAVALTIGLAWMIATPPGIFSDSVSGFLTMRSMEHGAPFNHTLTVDTNDIRVDGSAFTSWWTPGQYLIPMVFSWLGFDLGSSMLITVVLAWSIGVAGFWRLWRRLGFTPEEGAISVAVLVSQSYVLDWGRFYHGGELLQWSFLPWFILLALRCRAFKWHQVAVLSAALTLGIFFKSSFAIIGSSVLASLLLLGVYEVGGPFRLRALSLAFRSAISVGVALAIFVAYISLGDSPAGKDPWSLPNVVLGETLFAVAAPLGSIFDLWMLYIPFTEVVSWPNWAIGPQLLVASVVTALLLAAIVRSSSASREYLFLLAGVYGFVVAAFVLAFALDQKISFNVRHFRLAGVFFIPGVVAMLLRIPSRTPRLASMSLLAALSLLFTLRFAFAVDARPLERPVGALGFSHLYSSRAALDALSELEAQLGPGNNLIGVPWPQMALEVKTSRVYSMRTGIEGVELFRHKALFGRVDNLIVVVPKQFEEQVSLVLSAFKEHRDWRRVRPEVVDHVFMYSGRVSDLH